MYRILVVDDEMYVTDSLYNYINSLDRFSLDVYKAYSAFEALDYMHSVNFDIVISDIRMPGMDGIKFMSEVKNNWPYCRFIILTGFSEFEYVHQAMKYNCSAYVLKSDGYDEIENAISKAIADIELSVQDEIFHKYKDQNANDDMPIYRRLFLSDLLLHGNTLDISRAIKELQLPFSYHESISMVAIKILDGPDLSLQLSRYKQYALLFAHVQKYLGDFYRLYSIEPEPLMLVWLIQSRPDMQKIPLSEASEDGIHTSFLQRCVETLQSMMEGKMGYRTRILIDSHAFPISALHIHYRQAKSRLNRISTIDSEAQILIRDNYDATDDREIDRHDGVHILFDQLSHHINRINTALDSGNKKDVMNSLNHVRTILDAADRVDKLRSIEQYLKLVRLFLSFAKKHNIQDVIPDQMFVQNLLHIDTDNHFSKALEHLSYHVDHYFFQDVEDQDNNLLPRVRAFILSNLSAKLSLVQIANAVHYNPSYLSRTFKASYGINLFDYINTVKLEKAKEMLITTNDRIYEISQAVGFQSINYFYNYFKKYCGMSPLEYRINSGVHASQQ